VKHDCKNCALLEKHIQGMEEELEDSDKTRDMMRSILVATAAALKGEPPPLTLHDWSDLPALAKQAAEDAKKYREQYPDIYENIT
jgi:hypothetical protein